MSKFLKGKDMFFKKEKCKKCGRIIRTGNWLCLNGGCHYCVQIDSLRERINWLEKFANKRLDKEEKREKEIKELKHIIDSCSFAISNVPDINFFTTESIKDNYKYTVNKSYLDRDMARKKLKRLLKNE